MNILTNERLSDIINKIRETEEQVELTAGLKRTCHFGYMIGNLIQDLIFANSDNSNDRNNKRYVVKILREINEYFTFIGMNEVFRNYEFNPNLEKFPTTQEGLLGYTEMMKVMF
ncbi:hypothetical protein HYW74_01080 [Candidatus Pacearchaeota archaeon]|nr:hypothetical protein [Candidatus Pacearchaeota archaeon]